MIRLMVTLNARFDGKVLVPETPLDLAANQRVRISVETIDSPETAKPRTHTSFRDWLGVGLPLPTDHTPRFADDDALWEGSAGEELTNDPRKKKR